MWQTSSLYAVVSGLGGAIIVGPVLGALTGHLLALWALGALLVFCAAAVTMAFQVLFGVFGIALTLLLFVILGNPSAGGAYSASLLPPFWRAISSAIPNGAAVQAVRSARLFRRSRHHRQYLRYRRLGDRWRSRRLVRFEIPKSAGHGRGARHCDQQVTPCEGTESISAPEGHPVP